jgi:hypothetical protein
MPFAFAESPTDPVLVPLTHVSSDAAPGMFCDLQLGLSAANEILGVEYDCHGSKEYKDWYDIDTLKKGVVLFHYDALNIDVVSVAAPNLDVAHGGPFTIHYLSNYLSHSYADFNAELDVQGTTWTAYTSPDQGHHAFNDLFAVKRTVLGQLVGIQEVQATWK